MIEYSDYIVYVDESGDHGLQSIDPTYPIFVLAFCVFRKEDYATKITPELQRLKFRYFGHDMVILHEYDVRKARGDFKFLVDREKRDDFMTDLSRLVSISPFTLIAVVIRKDLLKQDRFDQANPYLLALSSGIGQVHSYLRVREEITSHFRAEICARFGRSDRAKPQD